MFEKLAYCGRVGRFVGRSFKGLFNQASVSVTKRVLAEVARRLEPVTFVQIGSNDADHGDPIRDFVRSGGWVGMMIEPVPYIFDRLVDKWKGIPGLSFLNCAIDESAGTRTFYYLERSDDPLPAWYDQLGSFHLENILKHRDYIPDIDRRVRSTAVECRSVADVVSENVAVFHCDVEGHDHRLVSALLKAGRRPEVILFEHVHIGAPDLAELGCQLREGGYVFCEDGQNTVAVLRSNARLAGLLAGPKGNP